ncbi:MAG: AAA family ATPase [Cyanobacteria bacterium J06642_9]
MANELLETFRTAYRNLDPLPLIEPKELEGFWVPYGEDVLAELEQLVEDRDSQDAKIIFAGHRGCGKSTLLATFGRRLKAQGYFTVFFSISDTIEMSDVSHVTILFAIAVNLMYEAEQEGVELPKGTRDAIYKWFATKTRTETETPVSAEVSAGFNLFNIIRGKLKSEASVRTEIKQEFERKISELVAQINIIAAAIQGATDETVLVIIDDLDKLDLADAEEIYRNHIKALFLPNIPIIFTTSIASLREASLRATMVTETNNQIVQMPVSKIFAKGDRRKEKPEPITSTFKTLYEALNKRMVADIIEPDIAEALVLYSGGLLRELVRLANVCCRICLRQIRREPERQDIKIDWNVLQMAVKDLRLDFETPLGKADYGILKTVYEQFTPEDPRAQPFLDLLHGLHVLEYKNDEIWYDVHPIVEDLLRLKGFIFQNM